MNDQTDSQLLNAYTEHRSEPAFAELVRRHVDFVYSAARRMVCDPHLAEDVTQGTFVALARGARRLSERSSLAGWLHRTAQNIAAQTVRTTERRRAREQEAAAMTELLAGPPDAAWERIAPHLDAALGELNDADREAVLLRYFQNQDFHSLGRTLGVSDDTAQKRVSRAVERLRAFFAQRGVTVGASGLVLVLSTNAVQAAPTGLASTISTAALLARETFITSTVAKGILLMVSTKQKAAFAIVIASLLVIGGTTALLLHRPKKLAPPGAAPSGLPSAGFEVRWVADDGDKDSIVDVLPEAGPRGRQREFRLLKNVLLDTNDVERAALDNDQPDGRAILLLLNEKGGRKFADATARNIGHQLAIVWGGRVINAPIIRSAILGRSVKITGNFTEFEAQRLLDALNHR